jgi:hypothetical protein
MRLPIIFNLIGLEVVALGGGVAVAFASLRWRPTLSPAPPSATGMAGSSSTVRRWPRGCGLLTQLGSEPSHTET